MNEWLNECQVSSEKILAPSYYNKIHTVHTIIASVHLREAEMTFKNGLI